MAILLDTFSLFFHQLGTRPRTGPTRMRVQQALQILYNHIVWWSGGTELPGDFNADSFIIWDSFSTTTLIATQLWPVTVSLLRQSIGKHGPPLYTHYRHYKQRWRREWGTNGEEWTQRTISVGIIFLRSRDWSKKKVKNWKLFNVISESVGESPKLCCKWKASAKEVFVF